MVFDLFGSLRGIVKVDNVVIDNNVFRLHYKVTVIMLVAASILVTGRQYFGDPIYCIQRDDIPQQVMDTFCWIHSTFTLPLALDKKVGEEVPAPGVDSYKIGDKKIYHKYYQWVCFVLFIQAILFYVPRYIWKMWEGGRIKSLILGLDSPIMDIEVRNANLKLLSTYLDKNFNQNNNYFYCFVFCELLNFINVICQMYLVDAFLGGAFSTYGIDVLKYSETEYDKRVDPMIKVFPRLTKCTFHRYGSSGDVQRHDSLCILPLNIINEKIYIFLWFWFVFLAVISGLILVYRISIILLKSFRNIVLRSKARLVNRMHLDGVMSRANLGDWFLLYLLSRNIDSMNYSELIRKLDLLSHKSDPESETSLNK